MPQVRFGHSVKLPPIKSFHLILILYKYNYYRLYIFLFYFYLICKNLKTAIEFCNREMTYYLCVTISDEQTHVIYCSVELTNEKYQAFVYAVKNHYWYQMYIDDLPIWGKWNHWVVLERHKFRKTITVLNHYISWGTHYVILRSVYPHIQMAMNIKSRC